MILFVFTFQHRFCLCFYEHPSSKTVPIPSQWCGS